MHKNKPHKMHEYIERPIWVYFYRISILNKNPLLARNPLWTKTPVFTKKRLWTNIIRFWKIPFLTKIHPRQKVHFWQKATFGKKIHFWQRNSILEKRTVYDQWFCEIRLIDYFDLTWPRKWLRTIKTHNYF